MMIARLKDEASGRSVLTAIVGSCRVFEPIASLSGAGSVDILWNRATPFTYDLRETLQYVLYCRGELEIPEDLKPYAVNGKMPEKPLDDLSALLSGIQLFIVEVSSLTSIAFREYYLNNNSMGTNFIRGKGKLYLDWWRDLIGGKDLSGRADSVVAEHAESNNPLPQWHEHVLREARIVHDDKHTLPRVIERLCGGTINPWMFVSHFQFSVEPDHIKKDRAVLLETLQETVGTQGYHVFDPSPVVIAQGREHALAGKGADQFHYAAEFRPIMGAAIHRAALDYALLT